MVNRQIVGVIVARGGSKGIPRKNLTPLCGRPLIEYTFQAARDSRLLDAIVLSTDDAEIADLGRRSGVNVPGLRPERLARDDSAILDVLHHVLGGLRTDGDEPEALVLLQPTSPLRRAEHIDAAVELLRSTQADSVVSVIDVPHQFNPASVMRLCKNGRLVPFLDGPTPLRRQDKPPVYARNGPAVLAVRARVLDSGSLYGTDVVPLRMTWEESVDIDSVDDLLWAEFLLERATREQADHAPGVGDAESEGGHG